MKVLQLSVHFSPNIGGVETHLDDLCNSLIKRGFQVIVLTYRPLHTKASWKIFERKEGLQIIRLPWIPNLFYKLINNPLLEFIYLLPGLFFILPFVLLFQNPDVIHAHGLVAGFIGVFWGKVFRKRVIISLHSIYHFPKKGLYKNLVSWIFNNADFSLGLSKQSAEEIKSLGVPLKKVDNFTYWIDLKKFKIQNSLRRQSYGASATKFKIKEQLNWGDKFVVLFVGRLVEGKGVVELLDAASIWQKAINLVIIGNGPLERQVEDKSRGLNNIIFLGKIEQDKLPMYYQAADLLIIPSTSEEGFGRVILESLACGTPVIGANRGAIPEAMNEEVGHLIEVSPVNIRNEVEYLLAHRKEIERLAKNCRKFAERRFSEENVQSIIRAYTA